MNYIIRPYQKGEEETLREICLCTAEEKERTEKEKQSLFLRYIDYYYENETVFVATDETNQAVGYILCAPDYKQYKKRIKPYARRLFALSKKDYFVYRAEVFTHGLFGEYPAHLHIDILPEYQKQGVGTALMNYLFSSLQKSKKSVHLICSATNQKGNSFYQKMGFKTLFRGFGVVVYGKKF